MPRINTMNVINSTRGTINRYYDANLRDLLTIRDNAKGEYDLIYDGFVFGYAQGMKAAKAEMRKGGGLSA